MTRSPEAAGPRARSCSGWPTPADGCIGPAGLFELLTLVGYYATLALQLRVFRVPAPEGPAPRA